MTWAMLMIWYAKIVNLLQTFEILCEKDKKEAFKCPWVDCNFLRHEWSNHTAKVYHKVNTHVNIN